MSSATSDVERFIRTRIMISALVIYLLAMGFMALGDRLYAGSEYLVYARLAAVPFFFLLLLRWLRTVRVRPPARLLEARQLIAHGRLKAARERLAEVDLGSRLARRVDRARRLLQDGLAIPLADEVELESGRCSVAMGELDRGIRELRRAHQRLPSRADVAIDLAEALQRAGRDEEAAQVLLSGLPYADEVDRQSLAASPALVRLLGDAEPPLRSAFARRLALEKALVAVLLLAALGHALYLYLYLGG